MNSLRKRAKLIESGQLESDERASSRQYFPLASLPIELMLLVLDQLSIRDLLRIRLVNKRFKQLLDAYERLWTRVGVRISFSSNLLNCGSTLISPPSSSSHSFLSQKSTSKSQLEMAQRFLKTTSSLNLVFINAGHYFRHKNLLVISNDNKGGCNNYAKRTSKIIRRDQNIAGRPQLTVVLSQLNVKCLNVYLDLIASNCRQLVIESFTAFDHLNVSSRHRCRTIKSSLSRVVKLGNVDCLTVDFSSSSPMGATSFEQPRILDELVKSFPNLDHFHLKHFKGPISHLIKLLATFSRHRPLALVQLDSCDCNFDLDIDMTDIDFIRVKHCVAKALVFTNSTSRFVQAFVNMVDLSGVESLELRMAPTEFEFDQFSAASAANANRVDFVRAVFFERDFAALKRLKTNIFDYQMFDDHLLAIVGRALSSLDCLHLFSKINNKKRTDSIEYCCDFFETRTIKTAGRNDGDKSPQGYVIPQDIEKIFAKNEANSADRYRRAQISNLTKLSTFWIKRQLTVYFVDN